MERLDLDLDAQLFGQLAIFAQLVAVVNGVELDGLVARLVVEALVVGVEAGRDHVRPLVFHEQLALGKPAVGDPVLDDGVALRQDAVAQPPPAGDVQIRKFCAVFLDLGIDRIGPVQMADRGAGIDRTHILVCDSVQPPRRWVRWIRRVGHRRVAGHGYDQFLQLFSLLVATALPQRTWEMVSAVCLSSGTCSSSGSN